MIKINKSVAIPNVLSVQGVAQQITICAQYDLNPGAYAIKYHKVNNPFKFKFKNSIYGHTTVKTQLIVDQHEKCCFCEGTFLVNHNGDVEHFRPKGGYKQATINPIGKPGYYWMAYDWDNLMFSCEICNRTHKKNLFPLSAGTARAISHHDAIELLNNCHLINPNEEDPEIHITFNDYIPVGITPKGKKSIVAYGLKRKRLNEEREKHLLEVKKNLALSSFDFATLTAAQITAIKRTLGGTPSDAEVKAIIDAAVNYANECAKDHSPYANMVRKKYPHLPVV